ncbi:alginate lyase family protein [Mariniflexile jejuense]|uniref:Alginate lyase family protein n=1 Tax=Mariniflexile jejuense TaxID=1173582 RepID=A0ABW3JL58_9FLAO
MKKLFLINLLICYTFFGAVGCSGSDDAGTTKTASIIFNSIANDDVIDVTERKRPNHTVSGSATGGYIAAGDGVIVLVNGTAYNTTIVSGGAFSVDVATSDLIADNTIDVVITSKNKGNNVRTTASKQITIEEVQARTFVHPGLLVKQSDFDRIKIKVNAGAEPWMSGWNRLINNAHSQSNYTPNPVVKLIRGGSSTEEPEPDNYSVAFNDAAAAFQLAIRWKVTGNDIYAQRAIFVLNSWARTCTSISGNSNKALGAGIYGYQFANAAEIMRDYSGWTTSDFDKFKKWMVDVFYPINKAFIDTHWNTCISHYWANWDLANISSILAIAVLTDDTDKYDFAMNYLKTGAGNGNLNKAVYFIHPDGLGQLQESGRDQGHALLCVGMLGEIAQMAYSQGDDIFGYDDNRILKGAEYSAKYNVANLSVPFQPYNNCDNVNHTVVSPDARGNVRPIWDLLYYHYVIRKGLSSPYLKLASEANGSIEGGGGDYGPNSGGYDSLGFGTLLYAIDE